MLKIKIKKIASFFYGNKQKGSILAYSLIIISIMIVIVSSLSVVTVIEKKNAVSTDSSVQAYQVADSGIQVAIKEINKIIATGNSSSTTIGSVFNNCANPNSADGNIFTGADYKLSFFSNEGGTQKINDCDEKIDKIQSIKSVGTYKGTVRAVQVVVAAVCPSATVQDVDGNTYNTVAISDQCWIAENLRTTKDPNGVNITSYCNPAGCGSPWGRLYDWNTAMNGHAAAAGIGEKIQGICPDDWHIPSDYNSDSNDDWQKLSNFLGGNATAGGKMKRTEVPTYWDSPNTGADNSSGFAAVAAGRYLLGAFTHRGLSSFFWSSSQDNGTDAWNRYLSNNDATANRYINAKSNAFSVRCVKD